MCMILNNGFLQDNKRMQVMLKVCFSRSDLRNTQTKTDQLSVLMLFGVSSPLTHPTSLNDLHHWHCNLGRRTDSIRACYVTTASIDTLLCYYRCYHNKVNRLVTSLNNLLCYYWKITRSETDGRVLGTCQKKGR